MARHRALQMFGRSGNPAFKSKAFTQRSSDFSTSEVMTLSGTVNKTGLYLLLCFMTAAWTWNNSMRRANLLLLCLILYLV